jgi:hypothetical protein
MKTIGLRIRRICGQFPDDFATDKTPTEATRCRVLDREFALSKRTFA